MPFPNCPEKYRSHSVVTPEASAGYRDERLDGDAAELPDAVVLCFSRKLTDYLTETRDGEPVDRYYGDLYRFDDTDGRVGVLGNFGIGAPTTAMLMEDLIADGVETFLSVGFAGCLDDSVEVGEFVVCEKAVRDEGTSHRYVPSEKYARASESLVADATESLRKRGEPFRVGPSWTTDAIYRETTAEIERYAEEGVLTVEVEASAVFAVADYRGVEAGAMFVVSDYLGPGDWEPRFHLTTEDLQRLGDTAAEILAARLD